MVQMTGCQPKIAHLNFRHQRRKSICMKSNLEKVMTMSCNPLFRGINRNFKELKNINRKECQNMKETITIISMIGNQIPQMELMHFSTMLLQRKNLQKP